MTPKSFTAGLLIPTGIGASVGGYGGDAMPVLNLLASVCDVLITHPNVANAAMFQRLPDNALYVEGYALDQFFRGRWALQPVRKNRVGVIFDAGIEPEMLTLHLNTVNSVQAVYGVEVIGYTRTDVPASVGCSLNPSGSSTGFLGNPGTLLSAARRLLEQGAEALAVCLRMPDEIDGETAYGQGQGVDPVGGIEAIVSHLLVSTFQVPAAHAPVFSLEKSMPEVKSVVDPRAASEYITPTFLPCILTGLSRSPHIYDLSTTKPQLALTVSDVDVLVVPADALGGIPMLACLERGIPVLAVSENETVMNVPPEGLEAFFPKPGILSAQTYLEATGMLQAMRLGLTLPLSTRNPAREIHSL